MKQLNILAAVGCFGLFLHERQTATGSFCTNTGVMNSTGVPLSAAARQLLCSVWRVWPSFQIFEDAGIAGNGCGQRRLLHVAISPHAETVFSTRYSAAPFTWSMPQML